MPDTISVSSLQMQRAIHAFSEIKGYPKAEHISASSKDPIELKKACAELESLFIFQLLKEMRSTIPKSGLLTGGKGEELYTSMFDAQIAREMASGQGIGLSTLLVERLGPTSGPEEKKGGQDQKIPKVPGVDNR